MPKNTTPSRSSAWRRAKAALVRSRTYAAGLYLSGLTSGLPLGLVLNATKQQRDLDSATTDITRHSSLIASDPDYERWLTPFGKFWIPKRQLSRESLFEMLAERQVNIYGGAKKGVRRGDVVIDCGANVGTFVAEALDAGASKIVACEPSPGNAECVRRNFEEELSANRVVLYPKGLWNETTTLRLSLGSSPAGDSFVRESTHGMDLPVTTIDALVSELALDRVDFVKMDIEGAERNALQGGRATIRRFIPRLAVSAYHLPDDPKVLKNEVKAASGRYEPQCDHVRLKARGVLHSRIAPLIYFFQPAEPLSGRRQ
jgi:FkbM family methyltransferase